MTGSPEPVAIPVAVVVMTRDEAANIVGCLASIGPRFAQLFVVDSASTDATAMLAEAMGATVVPFRWDGAYPKKKQWCLETLPFAVDRVLFVDADERLTPAFVDAVADAVTSDACAAFWITARPTMAGRTLRFGRPHRKIALLDRRRCRFLPVDDLDVATMWEVEGHYQPRVEGPVGRIPVPVLHRDTDRFGAWVARHNRYSDWAARMEGEGRLAGIVGPERGLRRWIKRLIPGLPARPLLAFLDSYVLRLGMLDGRAGLNYALGRAFYYWMIDVKRAADAEVRRR